MRKCKQCGKIFKNQTKRSRVCDACKEKNRRERSVRTIGWAFRKIYKE